MRRTLLVYMIVLAACGTNVVHSGQLYASEDPQTGEVGVELRDVESGGITLDAFGYADHEGAYFVLQRMGQSIEWQGVTEVVLVSGDQVVTVDIGGRELDAESFPPYGIQQFERVAFQLDDAQLEWLAASPELTISLEGHATTIAPKVLAALRDFAARVLGSHDGKSDLPPLLVPSDI